MANTTQPQFHQQRVAAQAAYDELGQAIEDLRQAVHSDNGRQALVHALPYQGTNDDGSAAGIGHWNEAPATGDDGRIIAMREIARTRCHYNQHPSTVTRAPGVLAASADTLARVAAVNDAKERFWDAAQAISPRQQTRSRELHAMIPRVSLMQIRRQLVAFDEKPERIHFTWAARTSSVRAVAAGDFDAELKRRLERGAPEHVDPERWRWMIEYARKRLAEIPEHEVIALETPMAPHVRANVYWNGQRKMFTAALPFFYREDGGADVEVHPLSAFDPAREANQRGDRKLQDEPLVEGLGLYRYRSECRRRSAA